MSKEKHDGDPMEGYASGKQVQFNMDWYDKLRASKPSWKFKEKYTVEPNNGHAIYIDAGQVFRFVQTDGPNICDVHFFGADIKDASGEHYETTYTAVFEGLILKKNSRIWSTVPYFRPMATYIDDNIDIEIYDTGITPQPSPTWHDWRPAHKAKIDRLKAEGSTAPRNRTFD